MFEVGDKVMVNSFIDGPKSGVIVLWYHDEGDVWVVEVDGKTIECMDIELSPA